MTGLGDNDAVRAVQRLQERGVCIPAPQTVSISPEVDLKNIAEGVVIHPGCRVRGRATSMGPGCVLGEETPATVCDCRLGSRVRLKGGFFASSVFLDDVCLGSASHVRPVCLFEEGVRSGHATAFKHTILFPFVTAGSLVNFCDILMAGGTGVKDYGEIGSSFVHFNYTPHGDKATASLIGDVPHGVLLNQPRVFLGGQGGLVGPVRLAYGSVLPAGVVFREDALQPGQMLFPSRDLPEGLRPYVPGRRHPLRRCLQNGLHYLGNLWALHEWYRYVRRCSLSGSSSAAACHAGVLEMIPVMVEERLRHLDTLVCAMRERTGGEDRSSIQKIARTWDRIAERLGTAPPDEVGGSEREVFLSRWVPIASRGHLPALAELDDAARVAASSWLNAVAGVAFDSFPADESRHGKGDGFRA